MPGIDTITKLRNPIYTTPGDSPILRHADVSMTLEIYANAYADGDKRSAPQAEGSPFDA